MSWIQSLYTTYQKCYRNTHIKDADNLCPVGYSIQNAHIEIAIDGKGKFRRARLVQKSENPKTLIPVTESSSGRTSGMDPHPLCDSIQYCAKDYPDYGGARHSYFNGKWEKKEYKKGYFDLLQGWAESEFCHPKVKAVYEYINKGSVVKDLIDRNLLAVENNILIIDRKSDDKHSEAQIMKLLTYDDKGQKDQGKAFVRWVVESDDPNTETWTDQSLFESWRNYLDSQDSQTGFCYVSGDITAIAKKHPARIRSGKDGAKLISSNDTSGYTFLGRFTDAGQVVSLSSDVTQKAHSALRWLIGREQAYHNDSQVFVSWATDGKDIPPICASTKNLSEFEEEPEYLGDVGQDFARRLNIKIAGYRAKIADNTDIVVMGLDSAVPGRMAITYYRELKGSEFLSHLEAWHLDFSWFQDYGNDPNDRKKKVQFVGAPAPHDIAWAAYGKNVEGKNGKKLMNATVERILPCIIDGKIFPYDLIRIMINRICNKVGFEYWEWEKCLGICCALFKGFYKERRYKMSLEEDRTTRDYLYGRLLGVADVIESTALSIARENRDTNAVRLMHRFADNPFSTWKLIEDSIKPYMDRIYTNMPGLLLGYKELLDIIHDKFKTEDYISKDRLSGEYLIAYHCQRRWFKTHQRKDGVWELK